MACSICHGIPGCPCCSEEPTTIPCSECNGEGFIYYNENGFRVAREDFDLLPIDNRDLEMCPVCEGEGVINYEYDEF